MESRSELESSVVNSIVSPVVFADQINGGEFVNRERTVVGRSSFWFVPRSPSVVFELPHIF